MLNPSLQAWLAQGQVCPVGKLDVFVVDVGPRDGKNALVLLHGFPSSSSDWRAMLPVLSRNHRVITLDFPGFGLSAKPPSYSYSLFEQADVASIVVRELGVKAAHLVAHDVGTSIACELVARQNRGLLPWEIQSLLLANGSLYLELAQLTVAQRILMGPLGPAFVRFSSERTFRRQIERVFGQPVPSSEIDDMWLQLSYRGGIDRLPQTIGYINDRKRFQGRWLEALSDSNVPLRMVWGTVDPIAVVAIAERLAREIPRATLIKLEGVGHYPQVEAPSRFANEVLRFLNGGIAEPIGRGHSNKADSVR